MVSYSLSYHHYSCPRESRVIKYATLISVFNANSISALVVEILLSYKIYALHERLQPNNYREVEQCRYQQIQMRNEQYKRMARRKGIHTINKMNITQREKETVSCLILTRKDERNKEKHPKLSLYSYFYSFRTFCLRSISSSLYI